MLNIGTPELLVILIVALLVSARSVCLSCPGSSGVGFARSGRSKTT